MMTHPGRAHTETERGVLPITGQQPGCGWRSPWRSTSPAVSHLSAALSHCLPPVIDGVIRLAAQTGDTAFVKVSHEAQGPRKVVGGGLCLDTRLESQGAASLLLPLPPVPPRSAGPHSRGQERLDKRSLVALGHPPHLTPRPACAVQAPCLPLRTLLPPQALSQVSVPLWRARGDWVLPLLFHPISQAQTHGLGGWGSPHFTDGETEAGSGHPPKNWLTLPDSSHLSVSPSGKWVSQPYPSHFPRP